MHTLRKNCCLYWNGRRYQWSVKKSISQLKNVFLEVFCFWKIQNFCWEIELRINKYKLFFSGNWIFSFYLYFIFITFFKNCLKCMKMIMNYMFLNANEVQKFIFCLSESLLNILFAILTPGLTLKLWILLLYFDFSLHYISI